MKTLKLQSQQLHDDLKKIANELGLPLEVCVEQAIKEFVRKYQQDYQELGKLKIEYYTERMKGGSELAKLVLSKMGQEEVVGDFVVNKLSEKYDGMVNDFLKGMVTANKEITKRVMD